MKMKLITEPVPANYRAWEADAGEYLGAIKSRREAALEMLHHRDPKARASAVSSFSYYWDFDMSLAGTLGQIAVTDDDDLVRLNAAACLHFAHLCYKDRDARSTLERLLVEIVNAPSQNKEIVEMVQLQLDSLAPDWRVDNSGVEVGHQIPESVRER